jgi:hypothetical protein
MERMSPITPEQQIEKMRREWDERARENARFYVNTSSSLPASAPWPKRFLPI